MRILITGGAGFVGSCLALAFRRKYPDAEVVAFDNLRRRGSELNLATFKTAGVKFQHGDIRNASDLAELTGSFDLFVEASAEPSVLAGANGDPGYVLGTNLVGTIPCLELARQRAGFFVFLSTSRVYSIKPLREIALEAKATRLELSSTQTIPGVRAGYGISEAFPTDTARSLYGATKLASELLVQEYGHTYGLKSVINRCGVLAGPGQFGKVDQGVFTLWVANHYFGRPLRYQGFGGLGLQVRDLLHPLDLFELIEKQWAEASTEAPVFNVAGGAGNSVSLTELTNFCRNATGNEVAIDTLAETNPVDIPYFVGDSTKVESRFHWKPKRDVAAIVGEIASWIRENETALRPIFCS